MAILSSGSVLLYPDDAFHRTAVLLYRDLADAKIVTTHEVLTELLTFFAGSAHRRQRAIGSVRAVLGAKNVEVIPQSGQSFLSGLDLYSRRLDKGYSLTDCVSMQTMRRENLTEVLTNDRHFEQEGFHALFRASR